MSHFCRSASAGRLEGFNNIKVAKRIGCGCRNDEYFFTLIGYLALPSLRSPVPSTYYTEVAYVGLLIRLDTTRMVYVGRVCKGKVIGWTAWCDPRYPDDDVSDSLFMNQRAATMDELRRRNIRFSGFYHQRGGLGVPVFDDGTAFHVSFRSWGRIMAEAFPEPDDGEFAYIRWAWDPPSDPDCVSLPNPDDYPGFSPWDKPLTEDDIREIFGD